jgi:hypothetical protein
MNKGEFLTRLSIWVTLAGYAGGVALLILSRKKPGLDRAGRLIWTIACLGLLVHTLCAFHFYHQWSDDIAYDETSRQTAEVSGINWGGGLYINYLLLAAWVIDVGWWWRGLDLYRRRSKMVTTLWQGFLAFIFFNATVVFETGIIRVVGIVTFLCLILIWKVGAARISPSEPIKDLTHSS